MRSSGDKNNRSLVLKLGLVGAFVLAGILNGCSLDRVYEGSYSVGKREIDEREQELYKQRYGEWGRRNEGLPEEEKEPYFLPIGRYKVR